MAKWRNTADSYGIIAQAVHWLVAAMVLVQLGLGLYAADLPVSLARLQWLSRHKSLGLAILAVMLLRIVWRWMNHPPASPASMPPWQQRAARATHWLLYALLLLAPLSGWLHASAAGLSANWFGLFQVPDLISRDQELSVLLKSVHKTCVALLSILLVGHVGAALWHAFVLRDGVLQRMLPWKSRGAG
jgi:cytochrome b561